MYSDKYCKFFLYTITVIGSRGRGYVFVCLTELRKTSKILEIKHEGKTLIGYYA